MTTRTFKNLDARSDGQRYQPDVLIQTSRASALAGWRDQIKVPASDRIVTFHDNKPAVDDARTALQALATQLQTGNDLGNLSPEEVEQAAREVSILEQAFACQSVRVDWIMPMAAKTLRWIAEKAANAVVGRLAIEALIAVGKAVAKNI